MNRPIDLHEETFPTAGNEIYLTLKVILRVRIHTLVMNHSNCDGESEDILRLRFSTPAGFKSALERAESENFDLNFDFDKMAKRAEGLPDDLRSVFPEIKAERSDWDKPIKKGNITMTHLSSKEARKLYGNAIFVGRSTVRHSESTGIEADL
jgi:hypothetical protein